MTPEQAIDEMMAVFKAAWDPRAAVYDDVPGNKPASEVPWARATVQHVDGGQSSLAGETGTRRFTSEGIFTVQVFAPVGDGSTACLLAATEVRNALRDARGRVWLRKVELKEAESDGAFNQYNVTAHFSYDEVR